jgi:Trypsin-like peptidase domain
MTHALAGGLLGSIALLAFSAAARAAMACDMASTCGMEREMPRAQQPQSLLDWAAQLEYVEIMGGEPEFAGAALTLKDYKTFGGIGAVVCQLGGSRRTSTAFLVGRFDVAVTVAHVFELNGRWMRPDECFYTNPGPAGQLRERIPIVSISTQWQLEPESYGQPASDLAVVRLAVPVQRAMRTMSLTRFAQTQAPVVLVGYRRDLGADALKRKSRGRVYPHPRKDCVRFTHDVDTRNVAPGAPLIDVRDNVVIGIHTRLGNWLNGRQECGTRGNAMIVMSEWLERTLRTEIASKSVDPPVQ